EMVYIAIKDYNKLKPCNIEFNLPQPNYTVNTLAYLQEKYPQHDFCLIMGEDNLKSFHKWKNYEVILEHHDIYVYPRISEGPIETQFDNHRRIHRVDAPIMELSSSYILSAIKNGVIVQPMLPQCVRIYLDYI